MAHLLAMTSLFAMACADDSPEVLSSRGDAGSEMTLDLDGSTIGDAEVQDSTLGEPIQLDAGTEGQDGGTPPVSVDAGTETGGADSGTPPTPPVTPRALVELTVYTANVENLPTTSDQCEGDWRDLYSYMAIQASKPDVFLVQQISDATQLNQLTTHMTSVLGRPYAGVIAEASPAPFNSPCGAAKDRQTNAIVYATDRMTPSGAPFIWQSYKNVDGACVLDGLSRTRGIALMFRDTLSNEFVSVASIHWSTRNGAGADTACAVANARQTDQVFRVHHPNASLYIFGGDTNEPDTVTHTTSAAYNGWYAETNGDIGGALGYLDPVWRDCNAGDLRSCLINNWTFRGANSDRRIDFIFARLPNGLPGLRQANTVTFNQANAADLQLTGTDSAIGYSDHRSVLTRLSY